MILKNLKKEIWIWIISIINVDLVYRYWKAKRYASQWFRSEPGSNTICSPQNTLKISDLSDLGTVVFPRVLIFHHAMSMGEGAALNILPSGKRNNTSTAAFTACTACTACTHTHTPLHQAKIIHIRGKARHGRYSIPIHHTSSHHIQYTQIKERVYIFCVYIKSAQAIILLYWQYNMNTRETRFETQRNRILEEIPGRAIYLMPV